MIKKKVQTVLFCRNANKQIQFLLLKTNQERGSFWQNITGSVDPGEDYIDAAKREAMEETGLTEDNIVQLTETNLSFKFTDRWSKEVNEKVFFLECNEPFEAVIDPSEHQNFKWIDLDQISRESVKYESNWQALEKALESLCV